MTAARGLPALVREGRKRLHLTQDALAKMIGKPVTFVVDMEREKVRPRDHDTLHKLAVALHLDPAEVHAAVIFARFDEPARSPDTSRLMWILAEEMAALATPKSSEDQIVEAAPRSYKDIEADAEHSAEQLFPIHVQRGRPIPVIRALERANELKGTKLAGCVRIESYNGPEEGRTKYSPLEHAIVIGARADVWLRAQRNEARSRFTLVHELAHANLHAPELIEHRGASLFRDELCSAASERRAAAVSPFRDPEWQSSSWAAAFLMPLPALRAYIREQEELGVEPQLEDIAQHFGMSLRAAQIRLNKVLPRLVAGKGEA